MGIWCYQVRNIGHSTAEYFCGRRGTANDLISDEMRTPDWCIGYEDNPLLIPVLNDRQTTWRVSDGGDWDLRVAVSLGRGGSYRNVGLIKILKNYARFNVWICDSSIVIENTDQKLGRPQDGKAFRFFVSTEGGTTESDDPACMINAMGFGSSPVQQIVQQLEDVIQFTNLSH